MDLVVPPSATATSTFSATDFFELPETGQMDFSSPALRNRVISVCRDINGFPTGEKLLAQLCGWCRRREIVLLFAEAHGTEENDAFVLHKTSRAAEDSFETIVALDESTTLFGRYESGCEERKHFVILIHSGSAYEGVLRYVWNPVGSKVETCDYTFEMALIEMLCSALLFSQAPDKYNDYMGVAPLDHRFWNARAERAITGSDAVNGENALLCVNQLRMERGERLIYSNRFACRIFPFPEGLDPILQNFLRLTSGRLFFVLSNCCEPDQARPVPFPENGDHQDRILADISELLRFDVSQRLLQDLSSLIREKRLSLEIGLCTNVTDASGIRYDQPAIVYSSRSTAYHICYNPVTGVSYTRVRPVEVLFEGLLSQLLYFANPEEMEPLCQTPVAPHSQWKSLFHRRVITGMNPDGSQEEMCVNRLREQMGLPPRSYPPPTIPIDAPPPPQPLFTLATLFPPPNFCVIS